MKSIFKKSFAFILAAVMVLSLAACGGYTANNTEFVIGVSGPLTGPAAVYGTAVKNSAQMAVDEINAAGGLNGVNFKLVATDDVHDATKVAANYASMLEGGMQVSLGTVTTAPGLEYTKLSKEDNVFFLTPSASGDKIPEFDNGFQMC
ncbi:MAG: amino acid ABC transporter substrate-binding protein, partial [Clostridia bacterium]|nr:amino acid ABC transporter substrate-binding protein [Clostridia bacterium]